VQCCVANEGRQSSLASTTLVVWGSSRLEIRYGHSDETREHQDRLYAIQKSAKCISPHFSIAARWLLYFGRNSMLRAAPLSNAKCSGSSSPGWHTPLCGRAFRVQLGPGAYAREAFHIAKYERRPVVLGIPYDLQKLDSTSNQPYETSAVYYPKVGRIHPDPAIVAEVVDRLIAAKRPIIIGGRGVLYAGAKAAVVKLADRCGALLANTLPTRGLFHDHEFSVGIPGSYFTTLGREVFETAEVVLAIGTSLSYYVGGGHYFTQACRIQVDDAPRGLRDGQKAADIYVKADALVAAEAILAGIDKKLGPGKPTAAAIRSKELARRIATEPADSAPFDIEPGLLDPREAIRALDSTIPKDWDIVGGSGHQAAWLAQLRGRPAERFTTVREFGAVGNGLSYALGVAAARRQGRDGKLVLIEGDGGLLFHIQELETVRRHGMRMLICVMNDGGYGSEFHKLRADGIDDSQAIFGRPAFENIARGFGLRGHEIRDVSIIPKLFANFSAQGESEIWNIQISDKVTAPAIRQTIKRGHGKL
jgi:acetolactate synthase-1/2/3 large subunit